MGPRKAKKPIKKQTLRDAKRVPLSLVSPQPARSMRDKQRKWTMHGLSLLGAPQASVQKLSESFLF